MNKRNHPNNTKPENTDQSSESISQNDHPVVARSVAKTSKKSKKKLIIIVVAVVVVLIGGTAGYFLSRNNTPKKVVKITSSHSHKLTSKTASTTSTVPVRLLQNGQPQQGVAVGYVIGKQVSMRSNPFEGQAYAASNNYQATVFYDTSNNQISGLNVVTKAATQLTHDANGAVDPVFSSIDQKLAYAESSCSVAIMPIATGTPTVIQKGAQSATCYKPLSWSPDGKYLAYVGTTETTSNLGLVNMGVLYIYDVNTNEATTLTAPAGFNSVGASSAYWQDATHIAVHYVDYGQFASILNEQLVLVDVSNQQTTNLPTAPNIDYSGVQLVGSDLYVANTQSKEILSGPDGSNALQPITGSDDTDSFLLQANVDNTAVSDIYSITGQPGEENAFTLNKLNPNGGQKTSLYTPKGFSAYMLGFGQSYDDIIYMDALSNTDEIHQYTVSSNTDEALVTDLPSIQQ